MSQDLPSHPHPKHNHEIALEAPLTREEREHLNTLSEEVYGKRLKWQKIMRKGQLKPSTELNGNGNPISVMRMHHFTLNEIYRTMKQILVEREEATEAEKKVTETEKVT